MEGYEFRFLIAVVPDPVDSGLPYMFDQVIESLQRAVEADNYVIDRVWVPWKRPGEPAKEVEARPQGKHPGLLLFRGTEDSLDKKKRLLAFFIVAETPTSGIHKTAFLEAVKLIRSCPACKPELNRVRVIGPFFSGSAPSLKLVLHETRKTSDAHDAKQATADEPLIKVVSGSASGFDYKNFVDTCCAEPLEGCAVSEPKCESTILPDELVMRRMFEFLGEPTNPTDPHLNLDRSKRPGTLAHEQAH